MNEDELYRNIDSLLDEKINMEIFNDKYPSTASIIIEAMATIARHYYNKGKMDGVRNTKK